MLADCGEADDAGGGGTPAGEPITLSVGIDSVYAPMFLAAAEELFADEGIRVELRPEQDPEAAAEATEEAAKVEPEQTVKAVEDLIFDVRDFDSEDLARLEEVGDFLLERGIVEERPPVETVFSPDEGYVP